MIKMRIA